MIVSLVTALSVCLVSPEFTAVAERYAAPDDILEMVDRDIAAADRCYFRLDGEGQAMGEVYPSEEEIALLFDGGVLVIGIDWEEEEPSGEVMLLYGELIETDEGMDFETTEAFEGEGFEVASDGDDWVLSGEVTNEDGDSVEIESLLNEGMIGAGTSTIVVRDGLAYLTGDLGSRTYRQLETLLEDHPEVETLVFTQVPGSINDEVNMHTGRLLHSSGLKAVLGADGEIASGGVDLFLSATVREVEQGARIGVHSWGGPDGTSANDFPDDHPAHQDQVDFFTDILGERGPAFYFYTIHAADFDDIHWMSDEEIEDWGLRNP